METNKKSQSKKNVWKKLQYFYVGLREKDKHQSVKDLEIKILTFKTNINAV